MRSQIADVDRDAYLFDTVVTAGHQIDSITIRIGQLGHTSNIAGDAQKPDAARWGSAQSLPTVVDLQYTVADSMAQLMYAAADSEQFAEADADLLLPEFQLRFAAVGVEADIDGGLGEVNHADLILIRVKHERNPVLMSDPEPRDHRDGKYAERKLPERFPEGFPERLAEIMGTADAQQTLASMAAVKQIGFWANELRGVVAPEGFQAIKGLGSCFQLDASQRDAFMRRDDTMAGDLYPINPSSVAAVRCLAAQPEQEVLDLAAAPGGKTLQLAAMMANTGRIAAVEPVKNRFHRLRANLQRCGVTNTQFYQSDGRGIGRKVPERFDRVLLDAPCSSEARIRLDEPDSYQHWKPRKIKESARKQRALLRSAFHALKPGGWLLYCTCSFAPEENELVVANLLGQEPAAQLLPITLPVGVNYRPGLAAWRGSNLDASLSLSRRVLPDQLWDGFFVCLLMKAN